MNDIVLFIGNGINNIENKKSWEELIDQLRNIVKKNTEAEDLKSQFPLVFENILNYGIRNGSIKSEQILKDIIASKVQEIKPHPLLKWIDNINPKHIITTNYDFVLEGINDPENTSIIKENKYSIFRKYKANKRTFWHAHGDCKNPRTINLGYEHYSGQLQMLRNYVVTKPDYKSKILPKESLINRIGSIQEIQYSWVDLFFLKEIHIVGLRLDFIEIDFWWLLTYRAKQKFEKGKEIQNKIFYYIPSKYIEKSQGKIELLENLGIEVKSFPNEDEDYYGNVFDYIKNSR
ncbi:MAG: SIR2 family protein [Bacteroidales bacterium]|nr:SIR2 family protein [Bacteroidales bacterium]